MGPLFPGLEYATQEMRKIVVAGMNSQTELPVIPPAAEPAKAVVAGRRGRAGQPGAL